MVKKSQVVSDSLPNSPSKFSCIPLWNRKRISCWIKIHSKHYVTHNLYLYIIYILEIFMTVFYILWLWQFFFSSVFPNFSQLKIFLTYEFNKDSLFLLIHFYNFRQRKESKLKWFNPMRIYAFYCWLIFLIFQVWQACQRYSRCYDTCINKVIECSLTKQIYYLH